MGTSNKEVIFMGVTVRQNTPGKGNPWWVFVAHNGNELPGRWEAKKLP